MGLLTHHGRRFASLIDASRVGQRHGRISVKLKRLLGASIALAIGTTAHAYNESFEGFLDTGEHYSALLRVSEESGDLIGHAFANRSAVGRLVLQSCLPEMLCQVDGATTTELTVEDLEHLPLGSGAEMASAIFEIERADLAYMIPAFDSGEEALQTRFGRLQIDQEQRLFFNGQPVLAPIEAQAIAASKQANSAETVQPGWQVFFANIRTHIRRALQSPAPVDSTAIERHNTKQQAAWEPVQGNSYLRMVDVYQSDVGDVVVLMDTGGTACPALFRVLSVTSEGAVSTPLFGTCSEIARIWGVDPTYLQDNHPDSLAAQAQLPVVRLAMTGFLGPFEPEQARLQAAMRMMQFEFVDGHIQKLLAAQE